MLAYDMVRTGVISLLSSCHTQKYLILFFAGPYFGKKQWWNVAALHDTLIHNFLNCLYIYSICFLFNLIYARQVSCLYGRHLYQNRHKPAKLIVKNIITGIDCDKTPLTSSFHSKCQFKLARFQEGNLRDPREGVEDMCSSFQVEGKLHARHPIWSFVLMYVLTLRTPMSRPCDKTNNITLFSAKIHQLCLI